LYLLHKQLLLTRLIGRMLLYAVHAQYNYYCNDCINDCCNCFVLANPTSALAAKCQTPVMYKVQWLQQQLSHQPLHGLYTCWNHCCSKLWRSVAVSLCIYSVRMKLLQKAIFSQLKTKSGNVLNS